MEPRHLVVAADHIKLDGLGFFQRFGAVSADRHVEIRAAESHPQHVGQRSTGRALARFRGTVEMASTLALPPNVPFPFEDLQEGADCGLAGWVRENARSGEKIGYDPKLHSPDAMAAIHAGADSAGAELVACASNLIDAAWDDQPEPPLASVQAHATEFAGEDHASKRARIGAAIGKDGADAAVITSPSSVAWLLNLRGGDVMCSPLPLSSAIIEADGRTTQDGTARKPASLNASDPQPSNLDGTLSHQFVPTPGPPGMGTMSLSRNDSRTAFLSHWLTVQPSAPFSATRSWPESSNASA